MAITTTTNKSLIKVTVGTESGTWGPYINSNEDLLDNMLGGTATIALTNAPVVLSSAQYQCAFLRFTGAITADIALTFPAVGSFYTIINDTTNSSNFCLTAATTAAGGRTIGIPPGGMTDILTDSVNARFRGLPPVGTYWPYAGSSVPRWVAVCTIAPYLNCDGSAFSSAVYPNLHAAFNNSNILPDLRGRFLANLNQGTGRITGADILHIGGGAESVTLSSQNMPNYALPVTDPGHSHATSLDGQNVFHSGGAQETPGANNAKSTTLWNMSAAVTGITVNSGGGGVAVETIPPVCVGGITMVRAT